MFEMHLCPNMTCEFAKKLKKNEKCPSCGTESAKIDNKKVSQHIKMKMGIKNRLFMPETTEEEIRNNIYEDMTNLASHEAGTGWMRWSTMLSLKPADQMLGAGFKMLVDQNKIIIRQNELIIRSLKELHT